MPIRLSKQWSHVGAFRVPILDLGSDTANEAERLSAYIPPLYSGYTGTGCISADAGPIKW